MPDPLEVSAGCPDNDAVDRFAAGDCDDGESARIRAHITTCDACRALIAALVKDTVAADPLDAADLGDAPLLRGMQVARYLIVDLIGSGAMGRVYAAYDPQLDRKVALKLLRVDASAGARPELTRTRMLREAQAMARLVHPNVVAVHDAGERGEQIHIAMELVDGQSLRAWLAERPRGWREVLAACVQAGRGLAAAHRAGLVHRDFKPDNVLVARNGRVLVTDFGVAAIGAAAGSGAAVGAGALRLTQTGALMGTPAYMAPEQLSDARVDARADIYAFAVSTWEALFGEHPFPADDLAGLRAAVLTGRPREPARRGVPGRVRRALTVALRADPAQRPQLDALLDELAANPRRRLALVALAGVALAALLLVVIAVRSTLAAQARARVASRLGQEVKEMELGLRAERLLPLHDLTAAERRVRRRLEAMRAEAGDAAAPHDAIGRGLVALGDYPAARVELEAALAAGADDPELHCALGYTLIRLHDHALDEARSLGGPAFVARQRGALDAAYLPAVRVHLERARGTLLAPPALLDAYLAYKAGDLDAALAGARASTRAAPLYYEARELEGRILLDRATGAPGDPLFDQALAAFAAAAEVGRSDAGVYDELASAQLRRVEAQQWELAAARAAAVADGVAAAEREIAASPESARGYTRLALLRGMQGIATGADRDGSGASIADAGIDAATRALVRDPADVLALDALATCLQNRGDLAADAGADPRPLYEAEARALAAAQALAPGFPWLANDTCAADNEIAATDVFVGRDPEPAVRQAVASCERARDIDPDYEMPSVNLTTSYGWRAIGDARHGRWLPETEARALAAAADPKPPAFVLTTNLLVVETAKLEYAAESGEDPDGAMRQLEGRLARQAELMRPEYLGTEGELIALEARATLAVVRGARGGAPVDRAAIERCLAIQPGRLSCRLLDVRARLAAGEVDAARAAAERVTTELPRSALGFVALAEAELRLGHLDAGLAAARAAVERAPDLPAAHAVLGLLAAQVAHDQASAGAALAELDLAVATNPTLAARLAAARAAMVERARSAT